MANKDLCLFKDIKDTGLPVHNQAVRVYIKEQEE